VVALYRFIHAGCEGFAGATNNDKEVLAMQGAKRLHAVMFRDVEGDLLGRLLMQGIRDNSTQPEALQHADTILQLGQSFAERKKILAGESFTIDFSADHEVQIYVNKTPLGKPLKNPAFNTLLLKIWLGDKPVDHKLKASLLGLD
jgi:Chalcone isomerase-like